MVQESLTSLNAGQEALLHRRIAELQTVTEVSTAITQILDVQEVLQLICDLSKEQFNLYHVHIYVVDEQGEYLNLAAGAGEPGRIMLERGHRIAVDHPHSLVAKVAQTRAPVIANDVTRNPDFLPNPLLPLTRSEMAIPMLIGDALIGVLDVQSNILNRFDDDDVRIKSALAAQAAVALENARRFETLQTTQYEVISARDTAQRISEANLALSVSEEEYEILAAIGTIAQPYNAALSILAYYDIDDNGKEYIDLVAAQRGNGQPLPVSMFPTTHILLDDLPLLKPLFISSDQFLISEDVEKDSRRTPGGSPLTASLNIAAMIAIPLVSSKGSIGSLLFTWTTPQKFPQEFLDVLKATVPTMTSVVARRKQSLLAQVAQERRLRTMNDLQVVTDVGNAVTTIMDIDTLLSTVVEMARERFNLYHVHIYLFDEANQSLVLAAGAGEPGRVMLERGHHIAYDANSIVARAARERLGVVVNDVSKDANFLPNPLLPDTKSEMAIPMIVSDRLIGVLDVQSERINRFDSEDVRVKTSLGSQVAIAVENARTYERRTRTMNDLQTVTDVGNAVTTIMDIDVLLSTVVEMAKERFKLYHVHIYFFDEANERLVLAAGAGEPGRAMLERGHSIAYDANSIVARAARERHGRIVNDVRRDPNFLPNPLLPDTRAEMAIPMLVSGRLIGVLDVQSERINRFDDEDVRVKTSLGSQVAIAVENARAYQRRIRSMNDLQTVTDVGNVVTNIMDINTLLSTVVEMAKDRFKLYHVHIYFFDEANGSLVLAAGAGEPGRGMLERGHSIAYDANSIVARAARERTGLIVNDVRIAENFLPNPLLPDTRAEMAIPMLVSGRLVGVLDVQSERINRFDDEDVRVKTSLGAQVAIAVENARAYQRRVRSMNDLQTVTDVGNVVTTIMDINSLLSTVVEMAKERFNLYHVHIYLFDEENDRLVLAAGAGEPGRLMLERGHGIPFAANSIVARAARERTGLIVNDVRNDENFLPNPLLPDTRAEMAIPMLVSGRLIGVLDVQSERINRFDDEDVRVKTSLGAQVAIAVENARAYVRRMRTVNDLQAVTDVGNAITTIMDIDTLLGTVVEMAKERFNLYHVHIYFFDEANERLVLAAGAGEPGRVMLARGHNIAYNASSVVARAARERQGVVVNDVQGVENFLPNPLLPDTHSEMAIPMMVGDQLIGVLDVQSERINRFDPEDVRVKTSLGSQIAIAVENARAFIRSEEARAETSRIYDLSLDLIGSTDFSGHFRDLNPAWAQMLGYEHEELVNASFFDFVHEEDLNVTTDALSKIIEGQPSIEFVNRYRGYDGGYRWIQWSCVADMERETLYFVAHDITDQRLIDEQNAASLVVAEEQAERERQTSDRLREVDRLKSQFLANMSHELRTPLNSIIGYSEILLDGDDGDLEAEAHEDVQTIYESGKHLLNLINEILDLAKIEAGEVQLASETFDVGRLIEDVIQSSEVLIKGRPIKLLMEHHQPGLQIIADPLRVRQIMTNLVSNGLKFTEKGSVTVIVDQLDSHFAAIRVKDTGVGIGENNLEEIFERFRQVDGSSTRRAGGTGLGLSITRSLVEMLGGEIHVESTLGEGSTFWFTVPLAMRQPA